MNEEIEKLEKEISDVPPPKTQSPEYKLIKFLSTLFIVSMLFIAVVGLGIVRELRTMSVNRVDNTILLREDIASLRLDIKEIKKVASDIDVLRHKIELVEIRVGMLVPPSNITTTSQGGNVQIGPQQSRREELRKKPKLKTSELAEYLGVTNETITSKIRRNDKGEPLCYEYGGFSYKVERLGNTFLIENPFYE